MSMIYILLVAFLITNTFAISIDQNFIVHDVKRTIIANSHVVQSKIAITTSRSKPGNMFFIIIPNLLSANLSYIKADIGKESLQINNYKDKEYAQYGIVLPESKDKIQFTIVMKFLNNLRAHPNSIKQGEKQFVLYEDSSYLLLPYSCEKQTTSIDISSSSPISYTKIDPVDIHGTKITYGPYNNIEAYKYEPITIHYENNSPFMTANRVVREIEVSLWGNIAVEEIYEIENTGAKLEGGFSRIDYEKRNSRENSDFRSLVASFPKDAKDAYYRDIIGNISTSHFKTESSRSKLELETRFPMFGGWKIEFYIGYNVPISAYVKANGNHHILSYKFPPSIHYLSTLNYTLKVILPEGASDISFNFPYSQIENIYNTTRYTYFDTAVSGRPVLAFSIANIMDDFDKTFEISYTLTLSEWREPMMLVMAFFVVFLAYIGMKWIFHDRK